MIASLIVLSVILCGVYGYTSDADADQIKNLPGAEKLNITFNQFSGYIPVGETKKLHYWFVEAFDTPAEKPLVFWSNGGPGCSGLLGFLTEQGPFRPNADMSLRMNEYAWNKVANMVFIEAPCGVGFSYSTDKDDYKTDDDQTASDNYDLIQGFLQRFPEYASNKLFITSESYGGHYMPTLAKKIVDGNTAGKAAKLNFKGFAVGNPYTTFYTGTPSGLATYWGHQLLPKPLWDRYAATCRDSRKPNVEECEYLAVALTEAIGNLNPYALDYPVCTDDSKSLSRPGRAQRNWMLNYLHAESSPRLRELLGLSREPSVGGDPNYEPCGDDYTTAYLNLPEVKKAIHVNDDIKWGECSYTLRYANKDMMVDMTPYYNYLLDGGYDLDILVYSGDDDSVCSTEGTQSWIWDLGYRVASERERWATYTLDGQTVGYATRFNSRLGFVTVHGAGHEVPTYTPKVALDLFTKYLAGEWTN